MKKTLLFIVCALFTGSWAFSQELIHNGDFSLPDDSRKYELIDSIPYWRSDDITDENSGRTFDDQNENEPVCWHWDGAKSIYQVIGTVPSVKTDYTFSFDATCMYSWWSNDYNTDLYVIFSSFAGTDTASRVSMDTLTFVFNCDDSLWFTYETLDSIFTIEADNEKAGENLVFEIDIYNSRDFGYGESYTYLYYDNVSVVASTPVKTSNIKADDINVYVTPGMLNVDAGTTIESANVFDLTGRVVINSKPNSSRLQFNTETLNHGVYVVKIKSGGKTLTQKVVL
ncbi:MAG TPA: T9SS type A sorting domain-containing protein [Bacteroidales bacterium]|nr:T9SS type A sorting domain-containing protein [Bacteroidales bacterium]